MSMNELEMFEQLVRQGLVSPSLQYPDLTLPSAYRSVPSVGTPGTAQASQWAGQANA